MNEQVSIFEKESARSRKTDPGTSKKAGVKSKHFSDSHERRILKALELGNFNGRELGVLTQLDNVSVMRRIAGMRKKGLVDGVLDENKPLSRSGCLVWKKCLNK